MEIYLNLCFLFTMKRLIVLIPFLLFWFSSEAQLYQDADSAFRRAAKEKKALLLYFSGSDWCTNCRRFEKNILADTAFQAFASENLVIMQADFPRKKSLSESLVKQNEKLAELYDPLGYFPAFVLFSSDRSISANIEYGNQHATEMISLLERKIDDFKKGK